MATIDRERDEATEREVVRERDAMPVKPNGPAAAAVLAGGIGAFFMGLITTLHEASGTGSALDKFLKWDANFGLGKGVGALSGKALLTVIVFAVAWAILHVSMRGREVRFGQYFAAAIVLIVVGVLGTFPIFFDFVAESFGH